MAQWTLPIALMICGFCLHADQLDILIAKEADISLVLPVICYDGKRDVNELFSLQSRALSHYTSPKAYKAILLEGLRSNNVAYRRSTSNLLLKTFSGYLIAEPRPDLKDVLELLAPNPSLTNEEFILLRKLAVMSYGRNPRK